EFWLARGLTALVGTLAFVVVYLICRELAVHKSAPWLAALFFAVEAISVRNSQYIRPDTYLVLFALVTVYFAIKIVDDPRARNYVFAGIAAGLATSSKYNAALVVIPIVCAHWLRFGWRGVVRREIYFAAFASLAAFFATTPYALLDWTRFWQTGLLADATHYATGHAGGEGDSFAWYLEVLIGALGWLMPLAIIEVLRGLLAREKKAIVLVSFPLVYFAFINLFTVHFDTTILPVISFLIICAALGLARGIDFLTRRWSPSQRAQLGFLSGLTFLLAFPMLRATVDHNLSLYRMDSRETARVWIEQNLPPDSRVAVEAYSPYVDPERYLVVGVDGIVSHSPDWYVQNGFEYLVFSYGTYGRFFEDRARYSEWATRYEEFFTRFPEVKQFTDGGFAVRIHRTGATDLPSRRVAARFGIYSGWIELVGYDVKTAQAGKPLEVVLYWRALAARREPLRLTVRVRDAADREIAQSSGDLFGRASAASWSERIARVSWTMVAPAEPGTYQLELNVDAEEQGRVPMLSRAGSPISDKLFIGPIKIAPAPPSSEELQRARAANIQFGDSMVLRSYALPARAWHPGDVVQLTLYWQSVTKMDNDFTMFVHLNDGSGNVRAQIDAPPRRGAYPTSIWDAGEIVRDDYDLSLPRDLAPGAYEIEIGMYEYPALTRLMVQDASGTTLGDRLILSETIKVTP
ncbi:MAG: glycosyltransferase family 39 protein, partial [Chloroflexota bacterium]